MKQSFMSRALMGLMLIIIGALFLLNQMDLLTFDIGTLFSTYWPVFLIVAGLPGLLWSRAHGGGGWIWNGFVVLLGVLFLLDNLGIYTFSFRMIWPIAIIFAGLSFLFSRSSGGKREHRRNDRNGRNDEWPNGNHATYDSKSGDEPFFYGSSLDDKPETAIPPQGPANEGHTRQAEAGRTYSEDVKAGAGGWHQHKQEWHRQKREWKHNKQDWKRQMREGKHQWKHGHHWNWDMSQDTIQRSSFIGDTHLGLDYWELKPTQVSHFIGDTTIDLTKASIPYGETHIAISSFIGDVRIFIPNDAQVEVRVSSNVFIGDVNVLDRFESGMFKSIQMETPGYPEAEKKIWISVSSFIGDVRVKRIG